MWAHQSDVVVSSACQSSGTERIAVCLAFAKGHKEAEVDRNLLKVPLALLFYIYERSYTLKMYSVKDANKCRSITEQCYQY